MTEQLKRMAEKCRERASDTSRDRLSLILQAQALIAEALVEQREIVGRG